MSANGPEGLVFDWRDPEADWPSKVAVFSDINTGEDIPDVQRVEFLPGWVRRDDGGIQGEAELVRLCRGPTGVLLVSGNAIRKTTERRRVRLAWVRP